VERDKFEYRISKERLLIIGTVIVIVWLSLLVFWYLKAEEVTKDPCSICAKRMGEKVTCTMQNYNPLIPTPIRSYYPNGTIEDSAR